MSEKKQYASYNLLKVMAVFMVISVHMLNLVPVSNGTSFLSGYMQEVLRTLLYTSNGLFFMLSGRFILESYNGKPGEFYWKRFVKIGIPVILVSAFYYASQIPFSFTLDYIKSFTKAFLQNEIIGYLWFVYALAGFYLSVPFLYPMFKGMQKRELRWLLGISLAFFLFQNLYEIMGLTIVIKCFPFYSWIFYCMLGYLLDHIELNNRQKKFAAVVGILCFCVSGLEKYWMPGRNPSIHDYSLTMIGICAGIYLSVTYFGRRAAEKIEIPINLLCRYSFFVYLFHGQAQNIMERLIPAGISGVLPWLFFSVSSFIIALVFAVAAYHLIYCAIILKLLPKGRM